MKLHSIIPQFLKEKIQLHLLGPNLGPYPLHHFSQGGEDVILLEILKGYNLLKPNGFFVDVGAYHPHIGSNTFGLYQLGWRGINIEARPGSKILFDRLRPLDINLEMGITSKHGTLNYYFISEDSPMNSFSKDYLEEIGMFQHVKEKIPIKTMPLTEVFEIYPNPDSGIDYLNIDAEGFDLEVILSNNFNKIRPKVISIEVSPLNSIEEVTENEIYKKLKGLGYSCVAKNFIIKSVSTLFFVDSKLGK